MGGRTPHLGQAVSIFSSTLSLLSQSDVGAMIQTTGWPGPSGCNGRLSGSNPPSNCSLGLQAPALWALVPWAEGGPRRRSEAGSRTSGPLRRQGRVLRAGLGALRRLAPGPAALFGSRCRAGLASPLGGCAPCGLRQVPEGRHVQRTTSSISPRVGRRLGGPLGARVASGCGSCSARSDRADLTEPLAV